ncbi:MAG: Na+/H+ antiporter [Candidatus Obscuribacterales bacterium]|nr:Na+/H+ antiporter [Candidatus Obscuribacterales bacterium]
MHQVEIIVVLLAVIGIVGALSHRLKIALPILLVFAGMMISLTPNVPQIKLEPDIVFFIFLPPLLYIDAFESSWKKLRNVAEVIALLAIGLVLTTVGLVAAAIHAVVPNMPWSAALALGAIVSPTDAVAAAGIAKEIRLPRRTLEILKGESLVNDATGLVAYQFAVAATLTGAFSWSEAGRAFLYSGFGGIFAGLLQGWLLSKLRTRLNDKPVEIIVSLLSPFIVYLSAEHLHVSSVLAVVTAGLWLGWRSPTMLSSEIRLHASANWETIAYVLNGFSFLLMGLQLKPILQTIHSYPAQDLILWTVTAALMPVLVRFGWIFTVSPIYYRLRGAPRPGWKRLFIVAWSGMRGVVSLAAALALPMVCADGSPFPYRNLLIFLTVAVIAATLVFQGITLPSIIKAFDLTDEDHKSDEETERKARLFLSREAVRRVDELARERKIDMEDPHLQRILNRYLDNTLAYAHGDTHDVSNGGTWHLLQHESLISQRKVLIEIRSKHEIDEDIFRLLQNELDLEEAQLAREHTNHV